MDAAGTAPTTDKAGGPAEVVAVPEIVATTGDAVSTAASLEEEQNASVDSSKFSFSKDAAEFVPSPTAEAFQFNVAAQEFQFNVGAQDFQPGQYQGQPAADPGSTVAVVSPKHSAVGTQYMQYVPVHVPMSSGGLPVHPVMAVQTVRPNGMRVIQYTAVQGVPMANPAGAVQFMQPTMAAVAYQESSPVAADSSPEQRMKGSGKGGHRQGSYQKDGSGRYQGGYQNSGKYFQQHRSNAQQAHASSSGSPASREVAPKAEEDVAAETGKQDDDNEKTEADDGEKEPGKRSWADIARQSVKPPASIEPARQDPRVLPKRVPLARGRGTAVAQPGTKVANSDIPAKPEVAEDSLGNADVAVEDGSPADAADNIAPQELEEDESNEASPEVDTEATVGQASSDHAQLVAESVVASPAKASRAEAAEGHGSDTACVDAPTENQPKEKGPPSWAERLKSGSSPSSPSRPRPKMPALKPTSPAGGGQASPMVASAKVAASKTDDAASTGQNACVETAIKQLEPESRPNVNGNQVSVVATDRAGMCPKLCVETEMPAVDEEAEEDDEEDVKADDDADEEEDEACDEEDPLGSDSVVSRELGMPFLEPGKRDANGVLRYSLEFLRASEDFPASQAPCPSSIPDCLRSGYQDGDDDEDRKRYQMEFLMQFKSKAVCQELPTNHRIPRDIRAAEPSSPSRGGEGRDGGASPLAEEDDWRVQSQRHQSNMKAKDAKASKRGVKRAEELPKLESSENSWASKQRDTEARKDSDQVVHRKVKAILNKLTIEKFDSLYLQLLESGIETKAHIENLMREVFEKATTQHHFIEMYTGLCIKLNEWLTGRGICDSQESFKRILLNQCQDSFEKYLKPPESLDQLSGDEQYEARVKYKTKMLGNMKFVGHLLITRVLSSKIIFQCADELFHYSSDETLETLCVFLTVIGPSFDNKEWKCFDALNTVVFGRVEELCKSTSNVAPRIRCLLKDVLELRAQSWSSAHKMSNEPEGPMRMSEVKDQWSKDNSEKEQRGLASKGAKTPQASEEWETIGSNRRGNAKTFNSEKPAALGRSVSSQVPSASSRDSYNYQTPTNRRGNLLEPDRRQKPGNERGWRKAGTDALSGGKSPKGGVTPTSKTSLVASLLSEEISLKPQILSRSVTDAPVSSSATSPSERAADLERKGEEFMRELSLVVLELALSHDLEAAVVRISTSKIAPRFQTPRMVVDIISQVVEQKEAARPSLWRFLLRLCSADILQPRILADGIEKFFGESYEDILVDVPQLRQMVKEEFLPSLEQEATDLLSTQQLASIREKIDQL
jgi:hypothetical protein